MIDFLFNLFSPTKAEKLKIDESKPLYVVRNHFDAVYYHMETYRLCKPIWYPLEGTFKQWEYEYNQYRQKLIKSGLNEELVITYDEWVKREQVGSDKFYKRIEPPKLTHECEIFLSHELVPSKYHDCEFLNKLVKERYEKK